MNYTRWVPIHSDRPVVGGGADPGAAYTDLLINTYGASEVWRLTNMTSATIIASVNTARNGTATGWDLTAPNAIAGPVTGESGLAPYSDGSNDSGNIFTSGGGVGLADIFDPVAGSVFMWLDKASDWTAAQFPALVVFLADANNRIYIAGNSSLGVEFAYQAGGTKKSVTYDFDPTVWSSYGLTWDKNAGTSGEVKAYVNGTQRGITQQSLGTWVGALTAALITSYTPPPSAVIDGNPAYVTVKFGSTWSAAQIAAMHAAATA